MPVQTYVSQKHSEKRAIIEADANLELCAEASGEAPTRLSPRPSAAKTSTFLAKMKDMSAECAEFNSWRVFSLRHFFTVKPKHPSLTGILGLAPSYVN